MLDQLRAQVAAFLAAHDVGILSTAGVDGAWAMPVRYRPLPVAASNGRAEVECLLPRWTDAAFFVEQDPCVLLLIVDGLPSVSLASSGEGRGGLRWLQIQGAAHAVADPDWAEWLPTWASPASPSDLYLPLRVTPCRVELFDEGQGWGARETLEL
jgi:hypothetical protein